MRHSAIQPATGKCLNTLRVVMAHWLPWCTACLHDDSAREYAYGPAQGLPDSKVGTFTQELYDEAQKDGWVVISMKNDWKQIFAFEK